MSSEDVLPTYEEAMMVHQTPWHIIEEETIHLTFDEPSATSKIKWFISRTESQHGVYAGPKKKNKIVVFVENMLTARTPKKFHMPSRASVDQQDLNDQEEHSRQHPKSSSDDAELFET